MFKFIKNIFKPKQKKKDKLDEAWDNLIRNPNISFEEKVRLMKFFD